MTSRKIKDEAYSAADKIDFGLLHQHIHFLSGDIAEANISAAIKWIVYENAVNPEAMLTLYVNSDGGILTEAFALIDIMHTSKCKIQTIGMGSICSAAFLIFVSGAKGKRFISKNTSIMCHQYTDDASGKYHDLDARIKETKLTNDRMVAVLTRSTNLDAAAVAKKLLPPSDVWLTPEELVKYAAADQII